MSGYLAGLLAMLSINVIVAYSVFLPGSAGLLNLGAAGFVLVGAYTAGALSSLYDMPLAPAIALGSAMSALVAFLIAFPILRTRGIYMVLATFAFAEVVAGVLLNIPALGGAAGLTVMDYAGLPVVLPTAAAVVVFVAWLMRTRFGLSVKYMVRPSGDQHREFGMPIPSSTAAHPVPSSRYRNPGVPGVSANIVPTQNRPCRSHLPSLKRSPA